VEIVMFENQCLLLNGHKRKLRQRFGEKVGDNLSGGTVSLELNRMIHLSIVESVGLQISRFKF